MKLSLLSAVTHLAGPGARLRRPSEREWCQECVDLVVQPGGGRRLMKGLLQPCPPTERADIRVSGGSGRHGLLGHAQGLGHSRSGMESENVHFQQFPGPAAAAAPGAHSGICPRENTGFGTRGLQPCSTTHQLCGHWVSGSISTHRAPGTADNFQLAGHQVGFW